MGKTTRTDVLILGGGPAGMSAASWCSELGLATILIERESEIGGQLRSIYGPIENYMGVRAENGREMLSHFLETIDRFSFLQMLKTDVSHVDIPSMCVRLDDDREISFRALIIATGVRRRRLGILGEEEFRGRGVIESGVRDRDLVAGKRVVIVGGGDAAIENALLLAEEAASLTVVHRRNGLRARAEFLEAMRDRDDIELLFETVVNRIVGDSTVTGVELEDVTTGQTRTIAADIVLIRIGVEPNSELVGDAVDVDEYGYLVVDASGQTSAPGVFGAGDVANPTAPTISTATGTGATAARSVYKLLKTKQDAV